MSKTNNVLTANIKVERAFTVGEIPDRIIVKIYNDNVWIDDPAQKKVIKKSSKEIIATNKTETIIDGNKNGIVTLKKVYEVEAPRSCEASIKLSSSSW